MPFKGDMRLGGARRNDSTLNGMSEGPDFPAAGTVLRSYVSTYSAGGTAYYSAYVEGSLVEGSVQTQNATYNVVADGNGGEYVDFANAYNITYKPAGLVVLSGLGAITHYTSITLSNSNIISVPNGVESRALAHDGSGGIVEITTEVFPFQSGTLIHTESIPYQQSYNGNNYTVGTTTREYRSANSSSEYESSDQSLVYYPPATTVVSVGGNYQVYINELGAYYNSGSYGSEIVWMGEYSGLQEGSIYSNYYSSGTFIVNANDYDYFHNGSGGYYSNYVGNSNSNPSSGTTTGNTSSGTNYITINGNSYENGSYSSTEYHDGNGGTYWETSYSYLPYGYGIYSESYTDEYGNTYYTSYNSDGQGGYYITS